MPIPGRTTITGPGNRRPSAASIRTRADSAAGLREQTALAAGEACTPADSAVSMVGSMVSAASTEEDSMVDVGKPRTNIAGSGGTSMSNLLRDQKIYMIRVVLVFTLLAGIITMTSCRKAEGAAAAK